VYHYRLDLKYIGTQFNGWQSQPDGMGIQDHMEKALCTLLGKFVRLNGASRTDSGVHAEHQVACFRSDEPVDLERLHAGLQGLIPKSIGIKSIVPCEDNFHPISDAFAKAYRYRVWLSPTRDPFYEPFIWRVIKPLDFKLMEQACEILIGKHDYSAFCSASSTAKTRIRTIMDFRMERRNELLNFWIMGDGFLKQMVRAMVGTVIYIGMGKISLSDLPAILANKDRTKAGRNAPADGLCLMRIFYEQPPFLEDYIHLTNQV
jgi:tRNA pseudouridine38-40 synthase